MQFKKTNIIMLAFTIMMSQLLFSCSKSINELSANDSIAKNEAVAGNESVNVYNSQQTWQVDDVVSVPCANNGDGEDAHFTGYIHFTDHTTVNGNHFILVSQSNYNAVSGTGLATGTRYVANGGGRLVIEGDFTNGQFSAGGTDKVNIIGAGPGNNSVAAFKARVVVNANGTVTHEVVDVNLTCK